MVLASQMASGSIKNGWLIAQVNLWLLWNNISAYQLYSPTGMQFMLVWLLPYKENVDLISVASSKDTRSVWALLLIFASTPSKKVDQSFMVVQVLVFQAGCRCLIVCRNSCGSIKGYDQLEMERGPELISTYILEVSKTLQCCISLGFLQTSVILLIHIGLHMTSSILKQLQGCKYRGYAGSRNSSNY